MFEKNKVEIGDILQHKIKGKGDWLGHLINFFTLDGNYAHTAIYTGRDSSNRVFLKAEAHVGKKFGEVTISEAEYPYIDIFRLKGGLTDLEKQKILETTKKHYGKEYDSLGLIGTIRSSLGSILNWKWLRQSKPLLNDTTKEFCSEAVSLIYMEAIGIDIAPQTSDYVTTPNDVGRSKKLQKIS